MAKSTMDTSGSSSNDVPPELSVHFPSIRYIRAPLKDPDDMNLPVEFLLVTVKNCEFIACYMQLKDPFKCWFDGVGYVYFGDMPAGQEKKVKVALIRCDKGSTGPGSSLIKNAVTKLRPKGVISVGTCSGRNPEKTKLGDVVVSAKLTTYASKIVNSTEEQSTGMKSYVSRHFLDFIKHAGDGWEAPLKNPAAREVKVHCDGIFTATFDVQIEWLVVKGIADYADGTECVTENWSPFASVMAASVVANVLSDPVIFQGWPHFKGNMADRRNGNMAIPLCLPNNCKWNAATGEYIKTGESRSSLYVVDEALQKLRTVRGPVCVVSIAGPYRKGKSYVLSEAFEQQDVFPLGHHFDPETMGIWMWVVPKKIRDSTGQDCTVILLDSEGIDAVEGEGLDDNQIFTLTVLLASVLIYNSSGVPTRHDLNGLDFIVKLSQRIKLRSSNDEASMRGRQEDTKFFHKIFPFFIWLLRDVTQSIPPDCKDIKEYFLTKVFKDQGSSRVDQNQEVAESILRFFPGFHAFKLPPPTVDEEVLKNINKNRSQINPEFRSGIKQFKKLLKSTLVPKHSFNDGEIVTGEGLAALVQLYVKAINTPGVIPNVQSAWETFVVTKCSEAADASLKAYDVNMKSRLSGQLPCDNEEIRKSHEAAIEKGIAQLKADTFGISTITTEEYLRKLTEACDKKLVSWVNDNERLTRESCTSLLKQLKNEHLDPVLARLHGGEGAKVMFEDIVAGYNRVEQDYKARATGAKDISADVFFEFHPEFMKEMQQYLGVLRQLKDFDENLSREIAAKAYQEQERIKLEEEYARLQQEIRERHTEMEMLQAKQEEETKILHEQMQAEAKAQQDQMDNMMKASMKQAEEDRQAFMQENKALNERLEQMQKLNEGMQQMVESLKQQLQQNQNRQEDVKKPGFFDRALQVIPGLAGVAAAIPKCSVM